MQALSIPSTLSLQFLINPTRPFNKENDLIIEETGPKLPPYLVQIAKNLATQYFIEMGQLASSIPFYETATLTFSPQNGLSIPSSTDPRIQDVFKKGMEALELIAYPEDAAQELGIETIKHTVLKMNEVDPQKYFAYDPISLGAWKKGIHDFYQTQLQIKNFIITGVAGQTTGSLRHPHLIEGLSKLSHKQPYICIVGPGMIEERGFPLSMPQTAELFTLFPSGKFLLIDKDQEAIDKIKKQLNSGRINYDPMMLRELSDETSPHYVKNEDYQKLFEQMKDNILARNQKMPSKIKAKRILNRIFPAEILSIPANKHNFEILNFDILTSTFEEDKKGVFDIVLATNSISNAFFDKSISKEFENYFSILEKFLALLKVNGSLYVDSPLFEDRLNPIYGEEGIDVGMQWLESRIGNKIKMEVIPLPEFVKGNSIRSSTIGTANKPITVSTSPIIVLTRLPDKTKTNQRLQNRLLQSLHKIFKIKQKSEMVPPARERSI